MSHTGGGATEVSDQSKDSTARALDPRTRLRKIGPPPHVGQSQAGSRLEFCPSCLSFAPLSAGPRQTQVPGLEYLSSGLITESALRAPPSLWCPHQAHVTQRPWVAPDHACLPGVPLGPRSSTDGFPDLRQLGVLHNPGIPVWALPIPSIRAEGKNAKDCPG